MIPSQFLRKKHRPLCIAHRGASALAPENTLASFRKAIKLGADIIEFDVQLTKDQEPVVFHDATLQRTTTGQGVLSEISLAEIKQLDAGQWFAPELAGEKVPTLDEALDFIGHHALIYLELKGSSDRCLVEKVVASLQTHPVSALIVSFDLKMIEWVKQKAPKALTGINFTSFSKVKEWVRSQPDRVDFLCPAFSVLEDSFLNFAEQHHKPLYVWNSDDLAVLEKWGLTSQIHALATNNPKIFFSLYTR